MAAEGTESHREGYPGICKVVEGMGPRYATHPEIDVVDEEKRAWTCRRLPMGIGRAVSMGQHSGRSGVWGHHLVQGRGTAWEGRGWVCPHPRGKGMVSYPPQGRDRRVAGAMEDGPGRCVAVERSPGKDMVCGLQRRRGRCTVDGLPRGLGMGTACEKRRYYQFRCWVRCPGLHRWPGPTETGRDGLGGRLDRFQTGKTTGWDNVGRLHREEGGKGGMGPVLLHW